MENNNNILQCQNVNLIINGNTILSHISLNVRKGETHLLIGENGAGKTTLINVLSGVHTVDEYTGSILLDGKEIHFKNTSDAIKSGVVAIHQDTSVYENLTVADNIYQYLPGKKAFTSLKTRIWAAQKFLDDHKLPLRAKEKASHLAPADKRLLELSKLYAMKPLLLILDEPAAQLGESQLAILKQMLEYFKKQGIAVLVISHTYQYLLPYIDSVSVFRDSHLISTQSAYEFKKQDITYLLWGDRWKNRYPKVQVKPGKEVLCLNHISNGKAIKDVSLHLAQREILGIYGKVGAGKSELAKTIFGIYPIIKGELFVDRLPALIKSINDAINLGIAYVTDERAEMGVYPNLTSMDNMFSLINTQSGKIWINRKEDEKEYLKYSEKMNLSVPPFRTMDTLSGGEQQKVMMLKWLLYNYKILILDEPTISLDIPSKIDIYNLLNSLVIKGASIIVLSSNLEELLGICDRTLFLDKGIITGEIRYNEASQVETQWLMSN